MSAAVSIPSTSSGSGPMSPWEKRGKVEERSSPGFIGKIRMTLVGGLETGFCKYGEFAAK